MDFKGSISPEPIDVELQKASFETKAKPQSESLLNQINLAEKAKPPVQMKPAARMQNTVTTAVPNSIGNRLINCLNGLFKPSSTGTSSALSSRAISQVPPSSVKTTKIHVETRSDTTDEETLSTSSINNTIHREATLPEIEHQFNTCKETNETLLVIKRRLVFAQKKDANLVNLDYLKNRYTIPILKDMIELSKGLIKYIEQIDKLSSMLNNSQIPEKEILQKEVKQMKQILLLEDHLGKIVTPSYANSIHKELKIESKTPGLSRWEEVCEYCEIDIPNDIANKWSALKTKTTKDLQTTTQILQEHQRRSLAKKSINA
jgi:hypothetical protein